MTFPRPEVPPLRTHSSLSLPPRCIYKKHKPKEGMTARLIGRAMQLERCELSSGNFTGGKTEARNGTVTGLSTFTEEFAYRRLKAELTRLWEWRQKGRGRWKKKPQYLDGANIPNSPEIRWASWKPEYHNLTSTQTPYPPCFKSPKNPASSSHSFCVLRTSYFALKKWMLTSLYIIRENAQPRNKPPLLFTV